MRIPLSLFILYIQLLSIKKIKSLKNQKFHSLLRPADCSINSHGSGTHQSVCKQTGTPVNRYRRLWDTSLFYIFGLSCCCCLFYCSYYIVECFFNGVLDIVNISTVIVAEKSNMLYFHIFSSSLSVSGETERDRQAGRQAST